MWAGARIEAVGASQCGPLSLYNVTDRQISESSPSVLTWRARPCDTKRRLMNRAARLRLTNDGDRSNDGERGIERCRETSVSCEECTVSCEECTVNLILDAERLCMDAERLCIVYNDVRTANDVGSIDDPRSRAHAARVLPIRHVSNT